MKRKSYLLSVVLASSVALAACGEGETQEDVSQSDGGEASNGEDLEPINVYTTLFAIENFAEKIGGEYVDVENIVPVGADAHTFDPTPQDMIDVADGDLFLYNGAGFEGFEEQIEDVLVGENVEIVKAAEGIDLIDYSHDHDHDDDHGHDDDGHSHEEDDHGHDDDGHGHEEDEHGHEEDEHGHDDNGHSHEEDEHGHDDNGHSHEEDDHGHDDNGHSHEEDDHGHDHDHGDEDPHIWLDPIRSIEMAENIKHALVDLQPEAEETFVANFEELKTDLEGLDTAFQDMMEEAEQDKIIVSHAGYGYWEDRYGIHQVGIAGLSPNNEPSIQQVQDVIDLAEDEGIGYVMFEQNIPTNIAETVREQVGAEDLWLHNLEALTDEDVENGEDYFSLMENNLEVLRTALQ
ncbi:metal ABC transporter solute-binding protein, Zn/Mn family [Texcoconibacillus texcoconensis]|nr:zinc ABC transporter substrate-binding protein [Texcoconibacillus texcoconensis]